MMRYSPPWSDTLPSGQCWVLVAHFDMQLEQMDVKTAFLHGDLDELVYMVQPEGFIQPGQEHLVSKKFLGMEIHMDRASGKLWLSQYSYVKRVLERFNMDDAKPCNGMLDVCHGLYKTRFNVSVTMASCSANNKVILQLEDMLMQTMQVTWMTGEHMAIAKTAKESLWLTGLVKELGIQQSGVQLYYDSQSAIYLAKNQVHTSENAVDMLTEPVTTKSSSIA
ncbi:Retrovirus-related Pol polyprotein from transposon TNT 1-94 [Vitis vinifera]|uniref:Retrovirus-related Pol polyprotein from transposon TNT 1-94 n=1 Tax=Vitis vinifera TaxID=29760 RepID=A0A438HFF7_VITVI|nr:Retrovirus-related Pol polyprotein from transposon TNT 1-94 [Vitis vinifera]